MTTLPSKTELMMAIAEAEESNRRTHHQVYEELRQRHPSWSLNIRRIKKLRGKQKDDKEEKPCIAMRILGNIILSASVTQGLLLLLENLEPIRHRRPNSNVKALALVEELLPEGRPEHPLVLFPKDQHISCWYYHIYYTARAHDECAYHPVMLAIYGRKYCPRGDMIIVKNGEGFTPQSAEFDVEREELGKTLWWYIRSGIDPLRETQERRMMRYIEQL
ncbi:uncharacterized protein HD556DRAFT_1306746 [Suillus plorans]|uniref:Uncharacterized protein n=1 Tax=Suillus plorans TaxID=116603 RepID=A0A9P7DKI7_9AGAM|nr:uncharacterized protein HD556DRAFT_1306746 [Suillus plorans]KAG1797049.1 hypothetical protein HD556DRAFT_1306746 [Suillus plorans]